jgi:two-component system sensor kinase FixL
MLMSRVDRMQKLIDGILLYSRVGQMEEEKTVVDLNELIPDIIDLLAPPENIEIKILTSLPTLKCEQTRITQVFQNLLSNAVKYIDKPKGEINISCSEDNSLWKFDITDNGPGIAKEHFERIFQIFQTLSRQDENGGTGIGLTIVKKNIELFGGKIWVESELGKGSTFFFTLPKGMGQKK